MATRKLGKGLDSLLSHTHARDEASSGGPTWVPVERLSPNRVQPRTDLERGLARLTESIRRHGIMQPILVTERETGGYEILAGERRWRAAQAAGLKSVPVLVRPPVRNDAERLELALIENVQREDLDPIERARACRALLDDFGLTQEEVAQGLGYDRSTIANLVRLLDLPPELQDAVSRETITAGHARALLRLNGAPIQAEVFRRMVTEEWSVRRAEAECRRAAEKGLEPAHKPRPRQPAWVSDLQERITRGLGLRAEIRLRRGGGGRMILHFQDLDELDRFAQSLDLEDEASELLES
ncbi:MAG: ParB/RepB/Spo0J family partition protein [Planctomycetota bacterium]|nr:MAG: ParB/RepB/Spo0J family partition protein [Planctomycetota bacterium]